MKILVVGGGGREHALAWKLVNDSRKPEVFCAPGNAGTSDLATNVPIAAEDVPGLVEWARKNRPDLTVVGPEVPLCAGLTDLLVAEGLKVFGPCKAAARMEGSKLFSKDVMETAGVPTAQAGRFTNAADAKQYVRTVGLPLVIKAEGLAAGKGVAICHSTQEADKAIDEALVEKIFGAAGEKLLIEEFLEGEEASILALIDGKNIVMLASAQDHKRVFDKDKGPNTGGMGAYSPAPVVTDVLWPLIREQVFRRTLGELRRRGIEYKGVLYAGLMIKDGKIKVLEFNCRFGDPETQAILPRIKGDIIPALLACADGNLDEKMISWRPEPCVCVVMAAGGYPGKYDKHKPIQGLDDAGAMKDVTVFHAGTTARDGKVVTSGGRVLGVTAVGADVKSAIKQAYAAVSKIKFDKAHYRKDIGGRALKRKAEK